jgi:hypothetical protein
MANIRRRIFSFHFSDALGRRRAPNFLVFPYNFSIQHRLPLFIFISPALLISRLPRAYMPYNFAIVFTSPAAYHALTLLGYLQQHKGNS